jgi:hypothetical protein
MFYVFFWPVMNDNMMEHDPLFSTQGNGPCGWYIIYIAKKNNYRKPRADPAQERHRHQSDPAEREGLGGI